MLDAKVDKVGIDEYVIWGSELCVMFEKHPNFLSLKLSDSHFDTSFFVLSRLSLLFLKIFFDLELTLLQCG